GWNQTAADYPPGTSLTLFERQAAQLPDRRAVSSGSQSLTYGQLNRRAEEIADHLRHVCVPGALVGICLERSTEMLAALLGIWKAGAAYVPLDPTHPRQRLHLILEDSGAQVLLTEQKLTGLFPHLNVPVLRLEDARAPQNSSRALTTSDPADLAYVLYTSGSTGRPKGVPIKHKSLANLLHSMSGILDFTSADRFLALTTISFDI